MAEGSFRVYQSFQEQGNYSNVFSATLAMGLLKNTYVPATSDSLWTQIVANAASASATFIDHIITGANWTVSGSVTQLTVDNHNFTSGDGLTAQYCVLFSEPTGQLIAVAQLSTGNVIANQINITLGTILKLNDSTGMY